MSGICGIYQRRGAPADRAALAAMLDAGAHRGPDGTGTWAEGSLALGHLALHTAPEDRRVAQPLVAGDLAITADARIDNRDDLIRALALDPAASSAQIIAAAYRRWGADFAGHLIGDFAVALWDGAARHLILARDPMSLRPLYYRLTDERLIFASEIAQILTVPGVAAELNELMIAARLASQPLPLDQTFYRGIAQLLPGHTLRVEGGRSRLWPHWQVDPGHRIRHRNDDAYADQFREIFKDAVRARLRSDRPTALMLSGGVDSGAVAATAGWLLENAPEGLSPLHTYSFAFETLRDCDERHVSRLITDHYHLPATPVPADDLYPFAEYPAHGPTRDAPQSMVFQPLENFSLGRARADGAATMLSGHRGDLVVSMLYDAFAYLRAGLWREARDTLGLAQMRWRRAAGIARQQLVVPALMAWGPAALQPRLRARYWPAIAGRRSGPPCPDWMRADFAARVGLAQAIAHVEAPAGLHDPSARRRYETIFMESQARNMVESNRDHARHGFDYADPWSDRRLVEFILAIPQDQVQRPGEFKRLAKRAMAGVMPEAARTRLGKVPLSPLADRALHSPAVADLLSNTELAARGYVDADRVQALLEDARAGRAAPGIWPVLNIERWLRTYWR